MRQKVLGKHESIFWVKDPSLVSEDCHKVLLQGKKIFFLRQRKDQLQCWHPRFLSNYLLLALNGLPVDTVHLTKHSLVGFYLTER